MALAKSQTGGFMEEWRRKKSNIENSLILKLNNYHENNDEVNFEAALSNGKEDLVSQYNHLKWTERKNFVPCKVNHETSTDMVRKNTKLCQYFGELCKIENSGPFIRIFLQLLPIVNNGIRQMHSYLPIQVAIQSSAFHNVNALLEEPNIEVNIPIRADTPLMMLIKCLTSTNYDVIKELIKILADKKADINVGDYHSHPISVLCNLEKLDVNEKRQLVLFCLERFTVDLDSYGGQVRKDVDALSININPNEGGHLQVSKAMLEALLRTGRDTEFLEKFVYFNKEHGDVYELLGQATVKGRQICAKTIFAHIVSEKKPFDTVEFGKKHTRILKIVCSKGYSDVLALLLKHVKDISFLNKDYPLHACVRSLYKRRFTALDDCFHLLLRSTKINIEASDHLGQTALHLAVERNMDKEALALMTRRSPYLGQLNRFSQSPLHSMNPLILDNYLDTLVTRPYCTIKEINQNILINLRPFIPPEIKAQTKSIPSGPLDEKCSDDMKPFSYIAGRRELRPLLKHPTISTFLTVKWLQFRWEIYVELVVCFLTTIFLSVVIYNWYQKRTVNFLLILLMLCPVCGLHSKNIIFICSQFKSPFRISFRHWINLLHWTLFLTLSFSPTKFFCFSAILTAGLNIILHIELLPISWLTINIVMMETVSRNFLKNFLVFVVILLTFAFSFLIMFAESYVVVPESTPAADESSKFNNFADLKSSLLKSIVMLTGEFDASSIDFNIYGASYLVFLVFLFLVTLVIANLINGLAVSDIEAIRQEAEVVALSRKVRILSTYEQQTDWSTFLGRTSSFFACYEPKIIIRPMKNNKINVIPISAEKNAPVKRTQTWETSLHVECEQATGISKRSVKERKQIKVKQPAVDCELLVDPPNRTQQKSTKAKESTICMESFRKWPMSNRFYKLLRLERFEASPCHTLDSATVKAAREILFKKTPSEVDRLSQIEDKINTIIKLLQNNLPPLKNKTVERWKQVVARLGESSTIKTNASS